MHIIRQEVRRQQHLKAATRHRSQGIPLRLKKRRRTPQLHRPKNPGTIHRGEHRSYAMQRLWRSKAVSKDQDHQFQKQAKIRTKKMSNNLIRERDTVRCPNTCRDLTKKKRRQRLNVPSLKKMQKLLPGPGECQRLNAKRCFRS